MATPEQRHAWKERIRTESPEVLFPGTPRAFEVTPAEKIRYEANAAFGAVLVDDLVWLVSAEATVTEEELLKRQAMRAAALQTDEQRGHLENVTKRLIELMQQTKKIGRKEILHRIQSFSDIASAGTSSFRFSQLDPEDIEVTPFGAVVVTIRDQQLWENELGFLASANGIKLTTNKVPFTSSKQHMTFSRVIFVKSISDSLTDGYRSHELFHDLYHQVVEHEMISRYKMITQREIFSDLQNELLAYAISEEWQPQLSDLLNRREHVTDAKLRGQIQKEISSEFEMNSVSRKEAQERAAAYVQMLLQVQSELVRLYLIKNTDFTKWMGCILASAELKELAYHLTQIEPGPLDADTLISRNADGTVLFAEVSDFASHVIYYLLSVRHLDGLIHSVKSSLLQQESKINPNEAEIDEWRRLLKALEEYNKNIVL